jgi:hypothetical protein
MSYIIGALARTACMGILIPAMLGFGDSVTVDFLPDEEAQSWVATELGQVARNLGPSAQVPRLLTNPPSSSEVPKDLDGLFDLTCEVQQAIGQEDVEFTLVELEPGQPPVPPGFDPIGQAEGHMLHAFVRDNEYLLLLVPVVFRKAPLVLGGLARELGRIALHRAGQAPAEADESEFEAHAELAAVALGMGVWIANGSYVFENACCGGGCGIDLKGLRAALSMPEACFALALDAQRKGLSRRSVARHLESTQRAAFKRNWSACKKSPQLALPPAGTGALAAG